MTAAVSIFSFCVSGGAVDPWLLIFDGWPLTVDRAPLTVVGWLVILEGGVAGVCANSRLVQSVIKSVNSPNFRCWTVGFNPEFLWENSFGVNVRCKYTRTILETNGFAQMPPAHCMWHNMKAWKNLKQFQVITLFVLNLLEVSDLRGPLFKRCIAQNQLNYIPKKLTQWPLETFMKLLSTSQHSLQKNAALFEYDVLKETDAGCTFLEKSPAQTP